MKVLLALTLLSSVFCSKILINCPSISKSHVYLCGKYADVLQKAGHKVVVFIPSYKKVIDDFNGTKLAEVFRIKDIGTSFDDIVSIDGWKEILAASNLGIRMKMKFDTLCFVPMCANLIDRTDELEKLKAYNFDLAITEDVDYCNFGVIHHLGIKNIVLMSSEPLMDHVSAMFGVPAPYSYVPAMEENFLSDRMTFTERAYNTYKRLAAKYMNYAIEAQITEVFREKFGPDFPSMWEIASNSSLVVVNTNELFDLQKPIIHKTVFIGLIKDQEKQILPQSVDLILNKGRKGTILISFGTVAPFPYLPEQIQHAFLHVIQKFKDYHFIIKSLKGDTTTKTLFESVKNVDLLDWIPQTILLEDRRIKLFVSHGGMNSVLESMEAGTPMLVIPIFTDQFRNGKNVERRNAGLALLRQRITNDTLEDHFSRLLEDDLYSITAKRLSSMMKDRPFSSEERLVKWINFVLKYYPFDNFDVEGRNLSFVEYYLLDIAVTALISLFAPIFVIFLLKRVTV